MANMQSDQAVPLTTLSARHPAKRGHDLADVRLSRARRRDYRTRWFSAGISAGAGMVHWTAFGSWRRANRRRLALLTTKASLPYTAFS
jgi:hypothetical protein